MSNDTTAVEPVEEKRFATAQYAEIPMKDNKYALLLTPHVVTHGQLQAAMNMFMLGDMLTPVELKRIKEEAALEVGRTEQARKQADLSYAHIEQRLEDDGGIAYFNSAFNALIVYLLKSGSLTMTTRQRKQLLKEHPRRRKTKTEPREGIADWAIRVITEELLPAGTAEEPNAERMALFSFVRDLFASETTRAMKTPISDEEIREAMKSGDMKLPPQFAQ